MTPNLGEAERLAECEDKIETDDQAADAANKIVEKLNLKSLLLTRSGHGMTVWEEGQISHMPVFNLQEVRDVSGAGDTVISSIALGLAKGWSLKDAATFASWTASIVVSKVGTATVTWPEVQKIVKPLVG